MEKRFFNRYDDFVVDGEFKIIPGIEIPYRTTDKNIVYRKNINRLDKLSEKYYGSPFYDFLILLANPTAGLNVHEIPDNFIIRIPLPLVSALQDYKNSIELYKLYYGE